MPPNSRITNIQVTLLTGRHNPALQLIIRRRALDLNDNIASQMVHHSDKRVRPISSVLERNGELGLVVFGVVVAVGLHGDVRAVGSGAAGGLETGGCAGGEEGEGEEGEAHFGVGMGAGWG